VLEVVVGMEVVGTEEVVEGVDVEVADVVGRVELVVGAVDVVEEELLERAK